MWQDILLWGRMPCHGVWCCAMGQGAVLWGRVPCRGAWCCATGQGAMPWGREPCHGAGHRAVGQGAIPADRPRTLPRTGRGSGRPGCSGARRTSPWCRGSSPASSGSAGVGRALRGARGPRYPLLPPPSPSSFPEHPVAQLLRQLQCAVYARLYPAVTRSAADATPASPTALWLDAGGSLPAEPGGRRLRASRSLHCMFSVPEHGPAALRHSLSSTPLADTSPGTSRAEGGGLVAAPQTPRESSFEDLERFLASPEGWVPAEPPERETTLPEQLKGVVRDIHNAIGEGRPSVGSGGGGGGHPAIPLCSWGRRGVRGGEDEAGVSLAAAECAV